MPLPPGRGLFRWMNPSADQMRRSIHGFDPCASQGECCCRRQVLHNVTYALYLVQRGHVRAHAQNGCCVPYGKRLRPGGIDVDAEIEFYGVHRHQGTVFLCALDAPSRGVPRGRKMASLALLWRAGRAKHWAARDFLPRRDFIATFSIRILILTHPFPFPPFLPFPPFPFFSRRADGPTFRFSSAWRTATVGTGS